MNKYFVNITIDVIPFYDVLGKLLSHVSCESLLKLANCELYIVVNYY